MSSFKTTLKYNIYSYLNNSKLFSFPFLLYIVFLSVMSSSITVSATTPNFNGGEGTKSLWIELMDLFNIFQDLIMVLGTICIFVGLILMFFKKQAGKKFLISVLLVIGASFVVPAGIMLLSIIGGRINDVLVDVFQSSPVRNSIETSK